MCCVLYLHVPLNAVFVCIHVPKWKGINVREKQPNAFSSSWQVVVCVIVLLYYYHIMVGCLPYNIKRLKASVVGLWRSMKSVK